MAKVLMVNVAQRFSAKSREIADMRREPKPGGRIVIYVTYRETMARWSFARTVQHRLFDSANLSKALFDDSFAAQEIEVRPVRLTPGIKRLLGIGRKPA